MHDVLFLTELVHVSNGLTDIDSNQLITPEFTVTETRNFLLLDFVVWPQAQHPLWLNIYIVNELNHRIPEPLYSKDLDRDRFMEVSFCFSGFHVVYVC